MAPERVVVVGASLAGLRAAEGLRREGHTGPLTVVGAETRLPYNRPPLSKQFLAGTMEEAACAFRMDDDLDVEWRLGVRATALDLDARAVRLDDGEALPFDGLVIATGSGPRPWPAFPLPEIDGIFTLRELDDAVRLQAALRAGARLVILGAGFIGCEVAATARGLGVDVALVDIAPRPMAPLGPELGEVCAGLHAEHGVELHLPATVASIDGEGTVSGVTLADGTRLAADAVLVATGALPNTDWLQRSGLELRPGVVCDRFCEAVGAPGVFAAGDVAQWPHPLVDHELVRVEHWSNAGEQGGVVAKNLLAEPADRVPYEPVPSFWSDQYDVKIQSVGFPGRADRMAIVEGSREEGRFVAAFEREGVLCGAAMFGMPRRMPWYRRAVAERRRVADVVAEVSAG